MRNRPVKIKCEGCGKRHDRRSAMPGVCARCEDAVAATSVAWSVANYLGSIEKPNVRASYASYLNKVARLLGFADRHDVEWSAIGQSAVDHVTRDESAVDKRLGSSLRSAFNGMRAYFAAVLPAVKALGRVVAPPAIVEVLVDLVRDGINLTFKATEPAIEIAACLPRVLDTFELTICGLVA